MLEYISDNISSKVAQYFEYVIPMAEMMHSGEKSFPKEYIGEGNYKSIDPDNFAGLCYFRSNGPVNIERAETKRPQNDVMKYTYPIRMVGCIKKSVLGKDDSYAGNTLSVLLSRNLEENNASLKSTLGANKANVKVGSFEYDYKTILSEEFKGVLSNGIPLDYCLIAIDLKVEVEIRNECIGAICNTYCGQVSPVITSPTSTVNRGGNLRAINPILIAVTGQYSYTIAELNGKSIESVSIDAFTLRKSQYTLVGSTFTITDTTTDIITGQEIRIKYYV